QVIDPVILGQPQGQTNAPGTSVTFTVNVNGTAPFTYRWFKDGEPLLDNDRITGSESATLEIIQLEASDSGEYTVQVSNDEGSVNSFPTPLVVTAPPVILLQPESQSPAIGTSATLSVKAGGAAPLQYQWTFNGTNLLNATNSSLTLNNIQGANSGSYRVLVSNVYGNVLSSNAVLTVVTDPIPPTVTVSTPAANAVLTTSPVQMTGTASDNVGVVRVEYRVNDGAVQVANGTTSWNASVALAAGTNTIVVRSFDAYGNGSTPVTRTVFYSVTSPLTIQLIGDGTVLNANGTNLIIGRNYKITAVPGLTSVLTNWTDSANEVLGTDLVLNFTMRSNLVLRANFIPNPFIPASGKYNGLFFEADTLRHESAGFVVMKVTPKLGYSGKLFIDGNAVSFSGKFQVPGTATRTISRSKFDKSDLQLDLALNFNNGSKQISGTLRQSTNWVAALLADRWTWSTNNPATVYSNSYTISFGGSTAPEGSGYALVKVTPLGKVAVNGHLSDGHRLKQSALLSSEGHWPFFAPAYVVSRTVGLKTFNETRGFTIGWLSFVTNAPYSTHLAPRGDVTWIKMGWTNQLYPNGFTNDLDVASSRFVPAVPGHRIIDMPTGNVLLTDGNLPSPISHPFTLATNNVFGIAQPNAYSLKLAIAPRTGLVKGNFLNPMTAANTPVLGVVLQDQNEARGFFVGTNQSGAFSLQGH
ncbi:MAG: immunoglobulin domain-containing protein, partial [Limisphaerales bacterium]